MRAKHSVSLLSAALFLSAAAAPAQPPAGPGGAAARWQALVGCWEPDGVGPAAVCVLPAGPTAVEVVTVVGGRVESRERIDASGAQVPSTRDKCAGWDQARWSPDGRRVYLRSEHTCDGVKVRSTGVMAVTATGEWLDVRGVSLAGGPADVRVRRYHELTASAALPAELVAEVNAKAGSMARYAARANAAEPITTVAVIEAAREVDARVLEAWIAERGEAFRLDAARLAAMADAGVPESVIDMVVAVSFPSRFAVNARARDAEQREPAARPGVPAEIVTDPYGRGTVYGSRRGDYCYSLDPLGRFDVLAGAPYCHGYSPYGWGRYGWGYGYGNYPTQVIVIREPDGPRRTGGRAVKGKGYSSGGAADGDRTAQPRSTGSGASTSAGSSSRGAGSSSTGSSSAGSSSSGSSGGERTAKPRKP